LEVGTGFADFILRVLVIVIDFIVIWLIEVETALSIRKLALGKDRIE
jgi:hypothetical protein